MTPELDQQSLATLQKSPSLREILSKDHVELDDLFDKLLAPSRADAREDFAEAWTHFEEGLRRHMELEEELILPRLKRDYPHEVEHILEEHAQIRSALNEMAVADNLHLLRNSRVEAFISTLRSHAAREDGLMYRWADAYLPLPLKVSVLQRARTLVIGKKRRL